MNLKNHHWAFLMHFMAIGGPVIPFLIWQLRRDDAPELDGHAYQIFNFQLTCLIVSIAFSAMSALIPIMSLVMLGFFAYAGVQFVLASLAVNKSLPWAYKFSFLILEPKKN